MESDQLDSNNAAIPIFIIGICPRSGTNFLNSIIQKHPDCTAASRGGQDNLLYGLNYLRQYVNHTGSFWKSHWGQSKDDLFEGIGSGLVEYLKPKEKVKAFVTKTPHTYNIDKFFDLLPHAKLVLIIRNGPDAIESGVKSFNWNYDDSFQMYNESGQRILKFIESNTSNKNFIGVKYEDIINTESDAMKRVLEVCELDTTKFDFSEINSSPIIGSSTVKQKGGSQEVHWSPVPKTAGFKPDERSKNWSKWQHYRFNFVSGETAKALGYSLKYENKSIVYYLFNYYKICSYFVFRVARI